MAIEWSYGRAQVVLLASLDAKFREDAQLAGPQVRSVAVDDASAAEAREHGISPLEVRLTVAVGCGACSNPSLSHLTCSHEQNAAQC